MPPTPSTPQMNIAAELDESCVSRSRPAIHKVKELPAVEAFLRQRKYHEHFILHGGLAAATKCARLFWGGGWAGALVRGPAAAWPHLQVRSWSL
jgi:hypothetical protein